MSLLFAILLFSCASSDWGGSVQWWRSRVSASRAALFAFFDGRTEARASFPPSSVKMTLAELRTTLTNE